MRKGRPFRGRPIVLCGLSNETSSALLKSKNRAAAPVGAAAVKVAGVPTLVDVRFTDNVGVKWLRCWCWQWSGSTGTGAQTHMEMRVTWAASYTSRDMNCVVARFSCASGRRVTRIGYASRHSPGIGDVSRPPCHSCCQGQDLVG